MAKISALQEKFDNCSKDIFSLAKENSSIKQEAIKVRQLFEKVAKDTKRDRSLSPPSSGGGKRRKRDKIDSQSDTSKSFFEDRQGATEENGQNAPPSTENHDPGPLSNAWEDIQTAKDVSTYASSVKTAQDALESEKATAAAQGAAADVQSVKSRGTYLSARTLHAESQGNSDKSVASDQNLSAHTERTGSSSSEKIPEEEHDRFGTSMSAYACVPNASFLTEQDYTAYELWPKYKVEATIPRCMKTMICQSSPLKIKML